MKIGNAISRMNRYRPIPMTKYRCEVCGFEQWVEDWYRDTNCWRCAEWIMRPWVRKIANVTEAAA